MEKIKKSLKKRIFPQTRLGKLSIILSGIFLICFICMSFILTSLSNSGNQEQSEFSFSNPFVIAMILIVSIQIISFFCGIISIVWRNERAILVFISTFIGFILLWFVLGEILVPH